MGRSNSNARSVWQPRGGWGGELSIDFDDGARRHTHHGMVTPDFGTISVNAARVIAQTDNTPRSVRTKAVEVAERWGQRGPLLAAERFFDKPHPKGLGLGTVAEQLGTTPAIAFLGMDDIFTARPLKGLGSEIWSPDRHHVLRLATDTMASLAGSVTALLNIERERI